VFVAGAWNAMACGGDSGSSAGTAGGGRTSGAADAKTPGGSQCRSDEDCPKATAAVYLVNYCEVPFEDPRRPYPNWCGEATCPPVPAGPAGTNRACSAPDDCVEPGAGASLCVDGRCAECLSSEDCPAERPACASIGMDSYRMCVECMAHSNCSDAGRPYCLVKLGLGGTCRECSDDEHCAEGVCVDGSCQRECESEADCENPAEPCSEHFRCEPVNCSDTSCPPNTECREGSCLRITCSADADCGEGFCVGGACHERFGVCKSRKFDGPE
jgi:hypothetical protein